MHSTVGVERRQTGASRDEENMAVKMVDINRFLVVEEIIAL